MRLPLLLGIPFSLSNPSFSKSRLLTRLFSIGGVVLGTGAVLLSQAPKAQALEEIKLSYGGFQFGSLSVQDLADFSATGQPSQEIESLLGVINVEKEVALSVLNTEVSVDQGLLEEASQTFIAESFFQLVGTTINMPNGSQQSWTYIKDALLASAADNQVSAIEFIQEFDADSVVVETEKIGPVVEQVQKDISTVEQFLAAGFL
ncbi:alpha/beta hydrolase [Oscillatoria sp. CS-180]|uniref:alpha/beta hydrolase n=1 Tax=Oscillatoria sp. CS-180 TaxID=3021720 RepID=UPI00232DD19C|nr:alpha/beta hydrolase [Oscillatoria sp. CS-180]MDB9526650.1 alpha/beta hydrolase [Oscillatoria sp. CS-180]